jgi:hypothetical protein
VLRSFGLFVLTGVVFFQQWMHFWLICVDKCSVFNGGRNFGPSRLGMCTVSQFWLICVDKCSVFNSGRNFGLFGLEKYGICNAGRNFGLFAFDRCSVFSDGRNFGSFGLGMCSGSQFWHMCVDKCSVFNSGRNFGLSVVTGGSVCSVLISGCKECVVLLQF